MPKLKLHWQILIALGLAVLTGWALNLAGAESGLTVKVIAGCKFVGTLFFNALKMLVIPLIVPSIICGMIGLGHDKNFGRLGGKTLGYYMASGLIAIITGLVLVNLIQPGKVSEETAAAMFKQAKPAEEFMSKVEGKGGADIANIFLRMVPTNILEAASTNKQLLGVIVPALLFGFFISRLPEAQKETQQKFWESLLAAVMAMTDFVIKFSPIGVFGLITPVLLETGTSAFAPLIKFTVTVLLSLGIHAFVTLPILLLLFGISPRAHFRAASPALLMAFSTASSASTLPVTLDCVKDAGVSNRVASFTLPLGATVNMDGTALYECVVVIFIAQVYSVTQGLEIAFATQFTVVLLALLTSVGVAGIPSASLVAIAVILGAVGLPVEAVGIVMVVDRVLDMCRTSVNVFSDTCGAAIIAKSEGETSLYQQAG